MRVVALDTETHLIGPGKVTPPLVCVSWCAGEEPGLLTMADPELETFLFGLLKDPNVRLVFHNASFDVPVLMRAFPQHETLWWDACEQGRVSCTMLREMLLNLSTSGHLGEMVLPDGGTKNIQYGLADLVLHYLDLDISEDKKGTDSWRTSYEVLEGLKAEQYPPDAARYAKQDASYCHRIYEAQAARTMSVDGYSSLATDGFQTAVSVALTRITERGVATDPERFREMQEMLAVELSDDKLQPLFDAGILRARVPPLPYVRQETKARAMLADWICDDPSAIDWSLVSDGLRQSLMDAGFKFKEGEEPKKNTEILKKYILSVQLAQMTQTPIQGYMALSLDILEEVAAGEGLKVKRTKTGEVCADKVVVEELAPHDPVLLCYQHREKLQKLVSTELPRMMWQGDLSPVVHFPFKTLVETSRTSSSASDKYPSANGQNVDPRARPIFVPRPGYVFCSTDYSTLELVCVAQTTYDLFGHSVHRDKINAGYDLHAYLGTQLAINLDPRFAARLQEQGISLDDPDECYLFFKSLEKDDPSYYKLWRKFAKPVGLGLPGGLGPWTLIGTAIKEPYFVDILQVSDERFQQYPEEFQQTRILEFWAKKLHKMKKPEDFRWTRQLKGIALAARLKDIWLTTYPEMVQYFSWVKAQRDPNNPVLYMAGDEEDGEELREVHGLCYTTPMGMHRAGATFTSAANGRAMQSPAAEGFKCAVFNLVRACTDPSSKSPLHGNAHVVNEIHDEIITELREDIAHSLALEQQKIMEESMAAVITDVKVTAVPALMRRWEKFAEPRFDEQGRLIPWEPKA